MSQFQDLDELLPITHKRLPIGGELHDFPDRISAESGVLLLRIQQRTRENPSLLDGEVGDLVDGIGEERIEALMTEILGRPFEEMLPLVGMSPARVWHVFQTLMAWHLAGEEAARELWNDPGKLRVLAATRTAKTGRSKAKGKSGRPGSRASSPTSASKRAAGKGGQSSSPTGD